MVDGKGIAGKVKENGELQQFCKGGNLVGGGFGANFALSNKNNDNL